MFYFSFHLFLFLQEKMDEIYLKTRDILGEWNKFISERYKLREKEVSRIWSLSDENNMYNKHWNYYSCYLKDITFDQLYDELLPLVGEYGGQLYGKTFTAKRLSCKFTNKDDGEKKVEENTSNRSV